MTRDNIGINPLQNKRIWLGGVDAKPQTRLFRKVFHTEGTIQCVRMEIYAETCYNLWINGSYVQRGPAMHQANHLPVAQLDLTPYWRSGKNVVAVAVHSRNVATHNNVPTGQPGLVARVTVETGDGQVQSFQSDSTWSATDQTGFSPDVPRRNWALAAIECYDTAIAPYNWQEADFDDSSWSAAEEHEITIEGFKWINSPIPLLRSELVKPQPLHLCQAPAEHFTLTAQAGGGAYATHLMASKWQPAAKVSIRGSLDEVLTLDSLDAKNDVMLWGDLGAEYTGQVVLECECESDGIIDVGWAETLANGTPEFLRKGTPYADRILASPGKFRWHPNGFSAGRYVAVIFRGFTGKVTVRRFGMLATEMDIDWLGKFECEDEMLNAIWRMCERSIRVGVQETLMDCPTREQAAYIGDGHPIARWLGMLTGNYGHWKYLIEEPFARIKSDGLFRSTVFTGAKRCLVDYVLLAIVGTRDYLKTTNDRAAIKAIIPHCRDAFKWFDGFRDENGLLHIGLAQMNHTHNEWENRYDPKGWETPWSHLLFIDHPGLGWHNQNEPGIDRRGTNAALNALYVVARRALAEMEDLLGTGQAATSRKLADQTAEAAKAFFCPEQTAFVDGLSNEGTQLTQISQQTNIWCLWAEVCPKELRPAILRRIFDEKDTQLARSGPYFWYYMLPILAEQGRCAEALSAIRKLWGRMIEGGASTLWETFLGDHLDTWCHPWSGAPVSFLLTDIVGLDPLKLLGERPVLCPRYDLLERAEGQIALPGAVASLKWKKAKKSIVLSGTLPQGLQADLIDPAGKVLAKVSGDWNYTIN